MERLLYVDDEENNLMTFQVSLQKWYEIDIAENAGKALGMLQDYPYKILVTDQRMPQMSGLELAKVVNEEYPNTIVIILTAFDDNETILKAINQGGIFRYLFKPWDLLDLRQTLESALNAHELKKSRIYLLNDLLEKNKKLQSALENIENLKNQLEEENIQLKEEFKRTDSFSEIIGESKVLKYTLKQLEMVSKSDSTVLLLGESGTGKELFANAVHVLSKRNENILVKLNCAAIPETLIESELFGYEKGAFTGANKLKYGKFELAHTGTIFLDEIGELPIDMQAKLLRVIQEGECERIGGTKPQKVDFRLIAATNRNLEQEVKEGKFRSDLYYRLNVVPITIPPLRERKEDIPLLVNYFITKFNRSTGKKINSVSSKDLKRLTDYQWPGNIRELENVVERAHVLSPGTNLSIGSWFKIGKDNSIIDDEIISLEENEKRHILRALKTTKWRIRGANGTAELLKINPSTLESRMKKLNIERPY